MQTSCDLGKASKKKSRTWDIVPTGGEGGPTPQNECPNLLKCFDTKIELNWSVSLPLLNV